VLGCEQHATQPTPASGFPSLPLRLSLFLPNPIQGVYGNNQKGNDEAGYKLFNLGRIFNVR
jgi:hypothetical protein